MSNRIFVGRQHFRVSLPWILHLPEKDLGGNGFSGLNGPTSIACKSLPFSGTGSNNSAIATKKYLFRNFKIESWCAPYNCLERNVLKLHSGAVADLSKIMTYLGICFENK